MVAWMQRSLTGRRVVNIYDGDSGEAYVFKLDGEGRSFFLIESGTRFHSIPHIDAGSSTPSPFCAKLRKHLRGLRLESVQQLGSGDRVVLFQFGVGAARHALLLELYAKGNIVLTDGDYRILSLLRSHVYQSTTNNNNQAETSGGGRENVAVQVGHVYPVAYATSTMEATQAVILGEEELQQQLQKILEQQTQVQAPFVTGKKKKNKTATLKTLLLQQPTLGVSHFGPALIEHCIMSANLDPNAPIQLQDSSWIQPLRQALQTQGPAVLSALEEAATTDTPGYILYQTKTDVTSDDNNNNSNTSPTDTSVLPHSKKLLQEFVPHLLKQHEERLYIQYDNFSLAVADFFAHIVTQKRLLKSQAAELAAEQKLERVRKDQQDRLQALQQEQEMLFKQAKIVQHQADLVDKALTVINSALDSGMDWEQLESLVEVEQGNNNPIALLIKSLLLDKDTMVLELPSDALDPSSPKVAVTIQLKLSAHANANALFDKYRASKEKAEKTIEASTKALAAAEENAKRQLLEAQKKTKHTATTTKRKPLWFEKFHYFVTSDNYLVLGGKDAHQNELLVKRYLRPGDAYLHADVFGAASCILRAKRVRRKDGKTETMPLSEQALREAGNFTICRSSAWTSRMVTSAWWVEANQVSKTAPTGEYLTVGSFMVRGKKNFLPPSQLEMGLAVLFRVSDDDIDGLARHKNERRDFALMAIEDDDHVTDSEASDGDRKIKQVTKKVEQMTTMQYITENDTMDNDELEQQEASTEQELLTVHEDAPTTADDDVIVESSDDGQPLDNLSPVSEQENTKESDNASKKKGLSVRDRKLIRKYGSLEEAARVLGDQTKDTRPNQGENTESADLVAPLGDSPSKPLSRGKKAKLKRVMKKYGDQDEEDRQLAMLALQGGEKTKKKGAGSKKKPEATDTQLKVAEETASMLIKDPFEVANSLPEKVRSILAECITVVGNDGAAKIRWDKFEAQTLEKLISLEAEDAQIAAAIRLQNLMKTTRIDNFSACLGGILRRIQKHGHENLNDEPVNESAERAKRMSKDAKGKEDEQWKKALVAEGISVAEEVDEDMVDDTFELNKLTGKPQANDLLLYAVPVCAPYQTLAQYTYRVKLTPGNMKRGKAAKQCVEMFVKQDGAKASPGSERFLSLIKTVDDNEWLQNICSDVKISASGASKLVKQQKSKAKKKK